MVIHRVSLLVFLAPIASMMEIAIHGSKLMARNIDAEIDLRTPRTEVLLRFPFALVRLPFPSITWLTFVEMPCVHVYQLASGRTT